ncbi:hypothetical protein GCM10027048_20420 [Hymenobacter coalescens]
MKTSRKLTITHRWRNNRSVPEIRLTGLWLREVGFWPNSKVRVELQGKQLVLIPE